MNERPAVPLSARELAFLRLVAAGIRDPEIAARLGISRHTLKCHADASRHKLGARTRGQAVAIAIRAGLID